MRNMLATAMILIPASFANAYDNDRAKTNQAHELAECAVFYMHGAEAVKRNGNTSLSNQLMNSAVSAMNESGKLSSEEVVKSRMEMAVQDQQKIISGDFSNISLLLIKYKDICKVALESPSKRYQYWLRK